MRAEPDGGSGQTPAVRIVTDADDPDLDAFRHLTDAAARRAAGWGEGLFIVEGHVALERVLDAGVVLRSVLATPARAEAEADLLGRVPDGVEVLVADRTLLAGVAGFDVHRGLLAAAPRPEPADPAEVLSGARRVVVAEGLNDHENLGALFRNAAGLGLDAVLLDDRSADPLYRRSVRVSLGWAAVLPHARIGPLPDGLDLLARSGIRTVALTPADDARAVDEAAGAGLLDDPVALVVGAEGPGLSADTLAACTTRVRIPMHGTADSLNVATSLAVVAAFAGARRAWR